MSHKQKLFTTMTEAVKEHERSSLAVLDAANQWERSGGSQSSSLDLREAVQEWRKAGETMLTAEMNYERA